MSAFSVLRDKSLAAKDLNEGLQKKSIWAHQWKLSFNTDPLKQAQKVIFSRKHTKASHPALLFNNNTV